MNRLTEHLREIAADRSRFILVTLGVIWGVLSLTTVLGCGNGFDRAMKEATKNSGVEILRLFNGTTTRPWKGRPAGQPIRLKAEDATFLQERIKGIKGISVEYMAHSAALEYDGLQTNVRVHGVDPIYAEMRYFPSQPGGRFINERDITERRRVAFIGDEVKARVFGSENPVGKSIELFGSPFTVIGVLRPKTTLSNYEGMDKSKILIPSTTFKALRGYRWVNYLIIWIADLNQDQTLINEVYAALGERHQFDPADRKAIQHFNHVDIQRRVYNIIDSTQVLLGIVTLLGFIVSMVSVANVMYVMVEERKREIGIQMALGARPAAILWDKLTEGVLITIVGGGIGVSISSLLIWAMRSAPLDPEARGFLGYPEIPFLSAIAISSLLGIAGCIAAYWPARRAAAMEPVSILHE